MMEIGAVETWNALLSSISRRKREADDVLDASLDAGEASASVVGLLNAQAGEGREQPDVEKQGADIRFRVSGNPILTTETDRPRSYS